MAVLSTIPAVEAKPFGDSLFDGLRELGWVKGRNLIVDARYSDGDRSRLPALAAELLALKPDVFLAATDHAAKAAAAISNSTPIVFVVGADPVGIGLVQSLAHPGVNATGFSEQIYELVPKRVFFLREALPKLATLAVLEYGEGGPGAQQSLSGIASAARTLGIGMLHIQVDTPEELAPAFESWARQGLLGFITVPNIWFFRGKIIQQINALALKYRIGTCTSAVERVESGSLMSYGVNYIALFRRSATLVDRILKGADPARIPVEQANVYELVLNKRTAGAIGITFPSSLLLQATRVIE